MFVLDIGLLGAMSRLNKRILLEGDRLFEEFKGALTEQYVPSAACRTRRK